MRATSSPREEAAVARSAWREPDEASAAPTKKARSASSEPSAAPTKTARTEADEASAAPTKTARSEAEAASAPQLGRPAPWLPPDRVRPPHSRSSSNSSLQFNGLGEDLYEVEL
ncbi:hypothetical protein SETIT_4G004200v2 [Setaria italica]|uniref:Uncharacterized protein n=1 Tax=Setaria italica TaxID=4555 RepID=A0A368QRA0_SETIT|nr:hypothetical protein SETIT_4G004200v2 [Setaria italica]